MKVETLGGPFLLFSTLALLVCKTARVFEHPLWLFGIALSMCLAVFICYWGYKEIRAKVEALHNHYTQQVEKNETLRQMFDEAQGFRREKVAQLEGVIHDLEAEAAAQEKSYSQLYEQSTTAKVQASAYKCSLEEALDEVRFLRQEIFFSQERMGKYPKDLPQRHEQLRAQFEEKSAILDQTRKRLFQDEGYLVILQKAQELQRQELNTDTTLLIEEIKGLIEENEALEQEVAALEQLFVTKEKKAPAKKKGKKSLEKLLEFQFDKV